MAANSKSATKSASGCMGLALFDRCVYRNYFLLIELRQKRVAKKWRNKPSTKVVEVGAL
jgi:hypothetical protein